MGGPRPDGGLPNNWLDFTGRPAWQWHDSGQYYLHNFLPGQPDLNWWEPAVHQEFARILEFWFERGVAGFRIDVANGLYKDAELRDNPPLDSDDPLEGVFGLRFVYNSNRPETHGVYRDWRKIAESYSPERLLLGETWVPDAQRLAAYYGDNDELQLGFNFPFALADLDPGRLAAIVEQTLAALPPGACPVWMGSNHDLGRFPSRWCGGDERKIRLALLVLATLPGTSVLYYGDEIGMTDVDVPVALRRDHATLDMEGGADRDRARTPMPWDGSPGGGFTGPGVTPWLPMAEPLAPVADQRDKPESTLSLCRRLLALRRAELGRGLADFENLAVTEGVWAYRTGPLVVAANFTDQPANMPAEAGEVLLTTSAERPRRHLASFAPGKAWSRAQGDEGPAGRGHRRRSSARPGGVVGAGDARPPARSAAAAYRRGSGRRRPDQPALPAGFGPGSHRHRLDQPVGRTDNAGPRVHPGAGVVCCWFDPRVSRGVRARERTSPRRSCPSRWPGHSPSWR